MIKSIIIVLVILSLVMLGCLNEEKRMAAIYHKDKSINKTLAKVKNKKLDDPHQKFKVLEAETIFHNSDDLVDKETLEEPIDPTDLEQDIINPNTKNAFTSNPVKQNKIAYSDNQRNKYELFTQPSEQRQTDFNYKTSVLMRLASGRSSVNSPNTDKQNPFSDETSLSEELITDISKDLTDEQLSDILDSAPEQNDDALESVKTFNFNLQKKTKCFN
jgi:hypothetical protein